MMLSMESASHILWIWCKERNSCKCVGTHIKLPITYGDRKWVTKKSSRTKNFRWFMMENIMTGRIWYFAMVLHKSITCLYLQATKKQNSVWVLLTKRTRVTIRTVKQRSFISPLPLTINLLHGSIWVQRCGCVSAIVVASLLMDRHYFMEHLYQNLMTRMEIWSCILIRRNPV